MADKADINSESNEKLTDSLHKIEPYDYKKRDKQRKRKRNKFLNNVKSFGKKGNFGHGTQIEPEQFTYFSKILTSLNESNGLEDKIAMANNVIEQTESKEVHFACNQVVSKIIEALIGFTDEENFERYIKEFSEDLRPICSDRFASHVLQKMIEIAFLRIVSVDSNDTEDDAPPQKKAKSEHTPTEKSFNLDGKFSESHLKKCENFFLKISKFLLNNLEDFYLDSYANHLIRTAVLALGGLYAPKIVHNPTHTKINPRANLIPSNVQIVETPKPEWQEILEEYATRLQLWPQFADLPYHKLSSALLANLLFAISRTNKNFLKKFLLKILKQCLNITLTENVEEKTEIESKDVNIKDDEDKKYVKKEDDKLFANYPKVFQHESSCCLLETMLLNGETKFLSKCYVKLFRERIAELSILPLTNFAVQKLLDKIEVTEFNEIFDSLSTIIAKLLEMGYSGVVYSMANACLRLQTKQGAFIKSLNIALNATSNSSENSADLFIAVLKLKSVEKAKADQSFFFHLNGSLTVQTILKYNKPIQMVNSILSQSGEKLNSVFQTVLGSYCADAFFESNYVGEKSKEKLVKLLEGNYLSLATNKVGSRVLETFFKNSNNVQKERIVKELAARINQLKGNLFGSFLNRNLNVETYKMSQSAWRASLAKIKI